MSKPNWKEAPKGATHWWAYNQTWCDLSGDMVRFYDEVLVKWISYPPSLSKSFDEVKFLRGDAEPRPLNPAAQRAKLAPAMWREFNRLKELRAAGDYLGVRAALPAFWEARKAWEAVV